MGRAKGERAVCDVDEDSVTMVVEAGRDCLNGGDPKAVDSLYFASTTMPFADRQNSSIIAEALDLRQDIATLDISHSQRAGTSALIAALKAAEAGGNSLLIAADCRNTKAASIQEMLFGDGAAALTLGTGNILAGCLGFFSITRDFIDHFRGEGSKFDYYFEERWIRDEGYYKMVPEAVKGLFNKTGISGADVSHFIMPCLIRRVREAVTKNMGIPAEAVRDDLSAGCGETGAAHPLVMLAHTLEDAKPGEKLVVIGFGQGADALLFETTDKLGTVSPRCGVKARLADAVVETNYQKYLSFKGMLEINWGMRAEGQSKFRPSAAWREHRNFNSLMGGRCSACGTVQFPVSHICVNPECRATDSQEEYSLAGSKAQVASYTVDRLAYSPNPPLIFGMIEFEEGAKFMMQFANCDPEKVEVGLPMEMIFRIKQVDRERNLRNYFWKAAPRNE
jgi:3-hydroxy-3-methylglutaryl CoA synthase